MDIEKRRRKAKPLVDEGFTTHIVDLLAPWCEVEPRRMFSGVGLFAFGKMFAMIFDETLFLKDSKDSEGKPIPTPFEKEYIGYDRQGKTIQLGYYKAPERALDDGSYLVELANESYRSACSQKKPRSRKSRTNSVSNGFGKRQKSV